MLARGASYFHAPKKYQRTPFASFPTAASIGVWPRDFERAILPLELIQREDYREGDPERVIQLAFAKAMKVA